jgi:hypothetical protein
LLPGIKELKKIRDHPMITGLILSFKFLVSKKNILKTKKNMKLYVLSKSMDIVNSLHQDLVD